MVRPQVYRIKKYEGKVVGDVIKARFDALKDTLIEQQQVRFSDLVNVENTVKGIVEPEGVPTILIPHYLNFGRELYSLTQRFSGATLDSEASLVFTKWKTRGLTVDLLKAIGSAFGLDTSGWE
jgi:hypothetical protein